MGFLFGENCYLSSDWNKLDFFIVLTGIIYIFFRKYNFAIIRTIRLLRPLRTINRVKGIANLVTSLIESLPKMLNVIIFLLFMIILLATFGLYLFNGMYGYRCRLTPKPVNGTWELYTPYKKLCNVGIADSCPEGTYCGSPYNYDEMNNKWN